MEHWRTVASRHVIDDQWLRVRADSCLAEDGVVIEPYYVFEYRDWVHVACFDAAMRILVTRQYRHALGDVSLELPGGNMDDRDASPLEAAQRELLEETGVVAERFEALPSFSPNPASHANRFHSFIAYGGREVAQPLDDPEERIEHEFITVERLLRAIDEGEMVHGLHVPTIMLALRRTGFLRLAQP